MGNSCGCASDNKFDPSKDGDQDRIDTGRGSKIQKGPYLNSKVKEKVKVLKPIPRNPV